MNNQLATQPPAVEIEPDPAVAKIISQLDISDRAKASYRLQVQPFLKWLRLQHGNQVGRMVLFEYKAALDARADLSVASKNAYLNVAKVVIRGLAARLQLPFDPAVHPDTGRPVKAFKQPRRHKEGLTAADVAKLTEYTQQLPDTAHSHRLRAILACLCLAGLRSAEVCQLDVADIDLDGHQLFIQGKGHDGKTQLPIRPAVAELLKAHLRASKLASGPAFISHRSRLGAGGRLTPVGLQLIVKRAFEAAGIDGKSSHAGRHYYITQLLEAGVSPTQTARWARHANINTLVAYDDYRLTRKQARGCQVFAGVSF